MFQDYQEPPRIVNTDFLLSAGSRELPLKNLDFIDRTDWFLEGNGINLAVISTDSKVWI